MSKSLGQTLIPQENVGASLSNDECDKSVACEGAACWVAREKLCTSLPTLTTHHNLTVTRLAWSIESQPLSKGLQVTHG